jgi:hypothetical protein
MNLRKTLVAALAGLAIAGSANLTPASATNATFTIGGGSLAVSDPTSTVNLGNVTPGSLVFAPQLGAVTVADSRGALVAAWTATVTSTDFVNVTTGGTSANEKVAVANIAYASGLGTNGTGTSGVFVPGVIASMALPAAVRVGGSFAGTGANSVSWNPTVSFTLLPTQTAGTYQGTITHSIA